MPVARGTQPLTQGAEPLTKDTQTLAPNTLPRPNSTKLVAARHTWTAAASSAPPTSPQRAQQQQEGGPRAPEWKGGPGGPLHEQGCEVQPLMCVMGKDSCMIERGRQVSRREEPLHGEEDLEQAGRGMRMSMDEKKNLLTPRANGHWDPTCSQKQSLRAAACVQVQQSKPWPKPELSEIPCVEIKEMKGPHELSGSLAPIHSGSMEVCGQYKLVKKLGIENP
eukprot:1147821-Pelagomonas_calceolata.AAC.7